MYEPVPITRYRAPGSRRCGVPQHLWPQLDRGRASDGSSKGYRMIRHLRNWVNHGPLSQILLVAAIIACAGFASSF
jgi:predicted exporter